VSKTEHHEVTGHHEVTEHHEVEEETLAPDESPTPLWLPVIGAVLFFTGFILLAAL
jgi:hypothetical protein